MNNKAKGIEGGVLLAILWVVVMSRVCRYIPEVGRHVSGELTILDLLDLALRIGIVAAFAAYYRSIMVLLNETMLEGIASARRKAAATTLIAATFHFLLLVAAYALTVPTAKSLLTTAEINHGWIITTLNVAFIVVGAKFIVDLWKAIQGLIEASVDKT